MKAEDIRKQWNDFIADNRDYFIYPEDNWYNTLAKVKEFIDDNNKRPRHGIKDKKEKVLGKWLSTQITNYKKKQQIMKDEDIRKHWKYFITNIRYGVYFLSPEDNWYTTLKTAKEFIDDNNKRPSSKSKYKKDKVLGSWLIH